MPTYIKDDLFKYFNDLKSHNDREWFDENKKRFQESVQNPLLSFISDFEPVLHELSPHFRADAKKSGGSLFRIYRDVRFSANKKPYKTHAAIQFRHEEGKNVHAPCFYLHLEPDSIFMGAGIYAPEPAVAQKIRLYIADHADDWKTALDSPGFKKNWKLNRDSALKRPPRNIDPEHPLIEDLKLKMFIASKPLTMKQVTGSGFLKEYAKGCQETEPMMRLLCNALKLKF